MENELFLNDSWTVYFHDQKDNQWNLESYMQLGNISTVDDWASFDLLYNDLWTKGMFFVMREHVLPMWEDENNKEGGCISFKVNKPEVPLYWYDLVSTILGENVFSKSERYEEITGVSVSPKRNYCILRIWLGKKTFTKISEYNFTLPKYTQIMFKTHMENKDYEN